MPFAESQDLLRIYYDDRGEAEPVLLCLPDWCCHQTMFLPLAEHLSAHHRVLNMDWRGHGRSQEAQELFPGWEVRYTEMLEDALKVIQASGAHSVIPITQGNGGWVAIALRRLLGERVPKIVAISWPFIATGANPLVPRLLGALWAVQDSSQWRVGPTGELVVEPIEQLFTMWLSGAPTSVQAEMRNEMGSHDFEMWSWAGDEIRTIYEREGDPLRALSVLSPPVPVLHVYAQPRTPEYLSRQRSFSRDHPWFAVQRLEAVSHFPTLEVPDEIASVIREFTQ